MTNTLDKGNLIAKTLKHSWRRSPSPLELSIDELNIVAPTLLASGAGALGWNRGRNSPMRTSPAGLELEQAYRLHALQSPIHERDIPSAMEFFRSAGI